MKKPINMQLKFSAKFSDPEQINENFTAVKVWVMALGDNRNNSAFEKDVVERAVKNSLSNIPIVGHLYVANEEDGGDGKWHMGSHDAELVKDEKSGKYKYRNLTEIIGTVPESHEAKFEQVTEKNGETKEYLTCRGIIWHSRFDEEFQEALYSADGIMFGQSMEIRCVDYSTKKSGIIQIKEFLFKALCALGKDDDEEYNVEPCFPEARIEVVYETNDDFNRQFSEMRELLSACFNNKSSKEVEDVEKIEEIKDEKFEDVAETSTENKPADTSANDEPAAADEPAAEETNTEEAANESEAEDDTEFSTEFSLTFKEKYDSLYNAVSAMRVVNDTECVFYDLADFDDKYCYIHQAYFSAEKPNGEFTKGRISYSESDNKVEIDVNSYTEMFVKWLTAAEVNAIEQLKGDYEKLEERVKEFEKKEINAQLEAVASEFSDLHEDEDFKKILEKASDYTVEAFQEKLFALRGKKINFSKKQEKTEVKIPFGIEVTKDAPYGGIVELYSNKN